MRRTCGLMAPGVMFGASLAAAGPPVGKGKMIDEKSDKVVSEVQLSVPRPLLQDPDLVKGNPAEVGLHTGRGDTHRRG